MTNKKPTSRNPSKTLNHSLQTPRTVVESTQAEILSGAVSLEDTAGETLEDAMFTTSLPPGGFIIPQEEHCVPGIDSSSYISNVNDKTAERMEPACRPSLALGVQNISHAFHPHFASNQVHDETHYLSQEHPPLLPLTDSTSFNPVPAVVYPRPIIQLQQWAHETRDEFLTVAEILEKSAWEVVAGEDLLPNEYDGVVGRLDDMALGSDGRRERL